MSEFLAGVAGVPASSKAVKQGKGPKPGLCHWHCVTTPVVRRLLSALQRVAFQRFSLSRPLDPGGGFVPATATQRLRLHRGFYGPWIQVVVSFLHSGSSFRSKAAVTTAVSEVERLKILNG